MAEEMYKLDLRLCLQILLLMPLKINHDRPSSV